MVDVPDPMRVALSDDAAWATMIETEAGARAALEWLLTTRSTVQADLARKKALYASKAAVVRPQTREARELAQEYHEWRSRALGFFGLVDRRLTAVKADIRRRNMVRVGEERNQLRSMVIDLGRAIQEHRDGTLSDEALHGLLDVTHLPHGDASKPLSELVALATEKAA